MIKCLRRRNQSNQSGMDEEDGVLLFIAKPKGLGTESAVIFVAVARNRLSKVRLKNSV